MCCLNWLNWALFSWIWHCFGEFQFAHEWRKNCFAFPAAIVWLFSISQTWAYISQILRILLRYASETVLTSLVHGLLQDDGCSMTCIHFPRKLRRPPWQRTRQLCRFRRPWFASSCKRLNVLWTYINRSLCQGQPQEYEYMMHIIFCAFVVAVDCSWRLVALPCGTRGKPRDTVVMLIVIKRLLLGEKIN